VRTSPLSERRTALVTGAARGVGRATVTALLDAGWRVVAGVRDVPSAIERFRAREGLLAVRMDVRDDDEVRAGVAEAEEFAGGALACVVLNAGHAVLGAHEETDLDVVRDMFETNLFGATRVTQAALPAMRVARRGVMVFVSSIGARMPIPLLGFYQASKAGMGMIAEALALELRPFGVRVAIVEPGAIVTEFGRSTVLTGAAAVGEGPYAALAAEVRRAVPQLRERFPMGPEEVARAIVGAASDPAWPFRTVLGGDAEVSDRLRRERADEAFQDGLVEFLGIDWPRATPAA
jgi:NAD(P)-dependent dehydrogenase (short-subunit alcohol dehydrogenase family)